MMRTKHSAAGHLTPTSLRCWMSRRYCGASGATSAFHFACTAERMYRYMLEGSQVVILL